MSALRSSPSSGFPQGEEVFVETFTFLVGVAGGGMDNGHALESANVGFIVAGGVSLLQKNRCISHGVYYV